MTDRLQNDAEVTVDAISFFRQLTTEQLTERIRQLDGERAALAQLLKAKLREEAIAGKRRSRLEGQRSSDDGENQ